MMNIASLLMAMLMVLNIAGGMTGELQQPVTVELHAQVDTEAVAAFASASGRTPGESGMQKLKLASDLLNLLSFRGTVDQSAMQMNVSIKGLPLLDAGIRFEDEGLAATSSMLNGTVYTLSREAIDRATRGMFPGEGMAVSVMPAAELLLASKDEIMAESLRIVDGAMTQIRGRAGEAETGAFEVAGEYTFTRKSRTDMTKADFAELVREGAKEICRQETVVRLLGTVFPGRDINAVPDRLAETFANIGGAITFSVCENDSGDCYILLEYGEGREGRHANAGFGLVGGKHCFHYDIDQNDEFMTVSAFAKATVASASDFTAAFSQNTSASMFGETMSSGMNVSLTYNESEAIGFVFDQTANGNGLHITGGTTAHQTVNPFEVTAVYETADGTRRTLGTVSGTWGHDGAVTLAFDGDRVQRINADEALNGSESATKMLNDVYSRAMAGILMAASVTISNLPPDSANVLTNLVFPSTR